MEHKYSYIQKHHLPKVAGVPQVSLDHQRLILPHLRLAANLNQPIKIKYSGQPERAPVLLSTHAGVSLGVHWIKIDDFVELLDPYKFRRSGLRAHA